MDDVVVRPSPIWRSDMRSTIAGVVLLASGIGLLTAQEKSVKPGINDPFKDPDVPEFLKKFEVESREIYAQREEIVRRVGVKSGMAVADVGAGTGLSRPKPEIAARYSPWISPPSSWTTSVRHAGTLVSKTSRLSGAQRMM
jgi:hypothetical protein